MKEKESKIYTCFVCGEIFDTLEGMQNCIFQHKEDVAWFLTVTTANDNR